MKALLYLIPFLFIACVDNKVSEKKPTPTTTDISFSTEDYEIIKAVDQKGLLILFPCFPCDAKNTKQELKIEDIAPNNGISLMLMNFNQRLHLSEKEQYDLATLLNLAISKHSLDTTNIYIGGFSGGGNVSLLLSNYLIKTKNVVQPKGVFIVDAPIDLLAHYNIAKRNIERNFSKPSVQESTGILKRFNRAFGDPNKMGIEKYEKSAPYTSATKNLSNIEFLKDTKVRFYTEPDQQWWKENRKADFEDMNAYYIKDCAAEMNKQYDCKDFKYYPTENRGYRANGVRHPHSWALVDVENLVEWMLADLNKE